MEEQGDDRTVDQAAVLGGLRTLEAAAGVSRAKAGGEDGGALVGGEAAGLAAAGRRGGRGRSSEPLDRPAEHDRAPPGRRLGQRSPLTRLACGGYSGLSGSGAFSTARAEPVPVRTLRLASSKVS